MPATSADSPIVSLGAARPRRRASLTPMVDVVFLLLVFFMLAARFGLDKAIEVIPAGGASGAPYQGAPRYVTVSPDALKLNGVTLAPEDLAAKLRPLMPNDQAIVIVAAREGASLQQVVSVLDRLSAEGFPRLVLAE